MKSKISFINRTMLQKNVKLYWPIWTLYTIVLLLNGPFSMWSRFKNAEFIYGKNWHKYMLDIISPAISMEADMIFIFVMALVTGMAMFSYLYNSRACNMIHSMPVTRRQLFSTNVLTGLLFMWIPQIIKYFMSFVICISYGNTKVVHIGINLLAANTQASDVLSTDIGRDMTEMMTLVSASTQAHDKVSRIEKMMSMDKY